MHRPAGVTVIAAICFLSAAYIGLVPILSRFVAIPVYLGTELSRPLQIGWPYLPLAMGTAWALIGWGLLRLYNWARWALMLTAAWGIASALSYALVFSVHLGWFLLQIAVRLALVWYLFRTPVAERFRVVKTT
jgi:hypothetical protein